MGPNLDPNFVKEQQQVMRMLGLKRAKKAKPVSPKKALLIILPVFVLALVCRIVSSIPEQVVRLLCSGLLRPVRRPAQRAVGYPAWHTSIIPHFPGE